jgi:hypothetical protein
VKDADGSSWDLIATFCDMILAISQEIQYALFGEFELEIQMRGALGWF